MFERFFKNRYGYSRWDGTQNIEGLDADDILKALSDDYMESGNLQQALKRLMQDGIRGEDGRQTMGLRELMERMREQRNQQLNRYNMASGVMDDLREKLDEIKQLERQGIQRRLDGESDNQQQSTDSQDQQQTPGGKQGQEGQQQHNGSQNQDGQEGQQGQSGTGEDDDLTPEQKRKMLEMIAKRKQDYLDKLPGDVPGQIKGLSEYDFMDDQAREKFKELMDSLQQQMMQQFFQGMQQSLQNMTPEDIAKMREMIRDLNKMLRERQEGKEPDFDAFMQKHGEYFPGVNSLDDLIEQMQQQMAAMQGIMDNLSPEQRQELQDLMEMREEAGYIQKRGSRWELTARGIRKIGQEALQDIFNKLKRDGFGRHVSPFRGVGGERTDESKAYQFGDPFLLDLEKTLMNALHRRGIGTPVGLKKEDFEVYRTEFTTQSSTVLMIDMSLSMVYNGCQPAAKKVAVALESLIRSQFPRDNLYIVGFSALAREYKPNELVELSRYDNDRGTNMAHGLLLARRLLSRHRGVNKQVIMITDGGPTVWYEEALGGWQFAYPSPWAEKQTLLEVQRCTREGITINTFMLYDDQWMVAF